MGDLQRVRATSQDAMILVGDRPEGMADLQVYVPDERGVFYVAAEVDAEIARLNQQLAMRIEIAESVAEELAGLGVDTGNSWDYARAAKETIEDLCAKITRLTAALARVRGQRDRLAIDMKHSIHADRLFCGSSDAKRESAEIMESEYGLRIENGEVKEIET